MSRVTFTIIKTFYLLFALFPLAAWGAIYWLLARYQNQKEDWRRIFLHTCSLWGAYLCLSTELLNLVHQITQPTLVAVWSFPVILTFLSYRKIRKPVGSVFTNQFPNPLGNKNSIVIFCITSVLFITATVAWLSPPQTWDSLNYHMARVAHWAQNKSLNHFATGIEVQNLLSPGGETAILHIYVLTQSDKLVNFIQWMAMLGSLIVCSWIAKLLGAKPIGQMLASLTAATIPMGIIQASSTVNDYVVAFWVASAAAETLFYMQNRKSFPSIFFAGLAASMAVWSKPTAVPYLVSFGVLMLFSIFGWQRSEYFKDYSARISSSLKWIGMVFVCVIVINSGHWLRNQLTYGNPFSDELRLATHRNQLLTPAGIVSNLVRNAAFHTGLPWGRANKLIYESILRLHDWLQLDVEDPRTTSVGPYPWMAIRLNEESAGNTLHAGLILVSLVVVLLKTKPRNRSAIIYSAAAGLTLVIFSVVFKWQIFGSRYHTPFFVLFAPLIGLTLEYILPTKLVPWSSVVLLLSAVPWLFSINSRPIIPTDQSIIGSILTTPRDDIFFANAQFQRRSYQSIANFIRQTDCKNIGLSLSGFQSEYLIWQMMGSPRSDISLEWFVAGTESEKYRDPNFKACAVICNGCEGPASKTYNGLPLVYQDKEFSLYLDDKP